MTGASANPLANFFERLFLAIAEALDACRVSVLRISLKHPTLQRVFRVRAYRLLTSFLCVSLVALFLSCLFPLWALLLGPILYGIPHLGASFRYTSRATQIHRSKPLVGALFALIGSICVYRLVTDLGGSASQFFPTSSPLVEPVVLCLGVFLFSLAALGHQRGTLGALILALSLATSITLLTHFNAFTTLGILTLLHNWVGFGYWFGSCKNKTERNSLFISLTLFTLITALIFAGAFDWIYHFHTPTAQIEWARLNYAEMGQSILPDSQDYKTWFHCIVAYAFGQSVHYFIWLKAIPEQSHVSENPTSFKTCYELIQKEFGLKLTVLFIILCLTIPSAWLFIHYPFARTLYFALASTHGFIELAGLGFALAHRQELAHGR